MNVTEGPPGQSANSWRSAWSSVEYRLQAGLTLLALLGLALFVDRFFSYIQRREGFHINDFLLNTIPPGDVSNYTFGLIYSAVFTGLIYLSRLPQTLLRGFQAYCLLTLMRLATLFLVPLEPDRLIIPLNDPFTALFFYDNQVITRDLFFSGHVSTLFLLALVTSNRYLKYTFFTITTAVAVLLIIQHVHYTIDILVAPVFAWLSYRAAVLFFTRSVPPAVTQKQKGARTG